MTEYTHIRENSEDTQLHLDSNREKFETDAQFLLRLMMAGRKLSAKSVVQEFGIADRRLRDLENEGKCEKQWVFNDSGKRMYVEYFVPRIMPPTKTEVIKNAAKVIEMMKKTGTQLPLL